MNGSYTSNKSLHIEQGFWLKTPHSISEPYDNPFWEKSNGPEGEKENQLGLSCAKLRLEICMSAEDELILTIEL